jgi:hypothetical protein
LRYSARPTWGTVVDAGTKEPVAGALVIAMWQLSGGMEYSHAGTFKISEAISNRFEIAGWGPEPAPAAGELNQYDPMVLVYLPGYVPKTFLNKPLPDFHERAKLVEHNWLANGQPLEIEKTTGPFRYYQGRWDGLYSFVYETLNNGSRCEWKHIPKTIRALVDDERYARSQGITPGFNLSVTDLMKREQCAPFDEFFRTYSEANWQFH